MKVKNPLLATSIISVLLGCASNPTVDPNISTEDYCRSMHGKTYNFLLKRKGEMVLNEAVSGVPNDDFGLNGLKYNYKPLISNCEKEGGILTASDNQSFAGVTLPTVLNCSAAQKVLWGVKLNFSNPSKQYLQFNQTNWFYITLSPIFYTGEQLAAEQNAKKNFTEKLIKIKEDQEAARENSAVAWRKTLKSGSTVEWSVPNRSFIAIGKVIKIEGEMVFVQFDNLKIGGGFTRFIHIKELYPESGKASTRILEI
jgi:hypothetical protein